MQIEYVRFNICNESIPIVLKCKVVNLVVILYKVTHTNYLVSTNKWWNFVIIFEVKPWSDSSGGKS